MKKEIDGVKVEAKSILTALRIIKEVCDDHFDNCGECPFFVDNGCKCGIVDLKPLNWKISDYKKWQALL